MKKRRQVAKRIQCRRKKRKEKNLEKKIKRTKSNKVVEEEYTVWR